MAAPVVPDAQASQGEPAETAALAVPGAQACSYRELACRVSRRPHVHRGHDNSRRGSGPASCRHELTTRGRWPHSQPTACSYRRHSDRRISPQGCYSGRTRAASVLLSSWSRLVTTGGCEVRCVRCAFSMSRLVVQPVWATHWFPFLGMSMHFMPNPCCWIRTRVVGRRADLRRSRRGS